MSTEATPVLEPRLLALLAAEAQCRPDQAAAASALFAEGATVPFVARYRKEATGGLDDAQVEIIAKRRQYFLELVERRTAILASIEEQGKLTPELEAAIRDAITKQDLEDLYLPYRPKRRTRAQIARERGLEPLAEAILAAAGDPGAAPGELAAAFVDAEKGVEDAAAAVAGARDILAERLAETATERARLRQVMLGEGVLRSQVLPGKEEAGKVYRDYFDYSEPVRELASHRLLALLRAEREGILVTSLEIDDEAQVEHLTASWGVDTATPCGRELATASTDAYKRLLRPALAAEARGEARERAELEAIRVFRANLEALLLQPPFGGQPVMGLDPGYRTGCKLAVVDGTGKVVATEIVQPLVLRGDGADPAADGSTPQERRAAEVLLRLVRLHRVRAIAIGNGTGSRETARFARRTVKEAAIDAVAVAVVPETGASVYSASAVAREELPELDVSLRGAVSIARRLQDPLAELVKIEPKALGVGQYQHDVDQKSLADELDAAVESAVNRVGVELNTASPSLLRRVSGLSERLAREIVRHRDQHGPYRSRRDLLAVSGLGPKTFEQSAGFLRIHDGSHPLDRTAVHPERYAVVESMARELGVPLGDLVGRPDLVGKLDFSRFGDAASGLGSFTLADIRAELERPGRDPRPEFKVPEWRDDVATVADLQVDMVLEGRVSNVTNFGAFVDIGVKRDGLVHVSELSQRFVDDPRKAVQVGQIVRVKVLEVDRERERISLSIKALEPPVATPKRAPAAADRRGPSAGGSAAPGGPRRNDRAADGNAPPRRPEPNRPPRPQQPARPAPAKPTATLADLLAKYKKP
jgi:uncharacterized protein